MPTAPTHVRTDASIFDAGNPGFRENFDEKPFEFTHCFSADHPLFQLPRLRQLIDNPITHPGIYYDAGDIGIGQRWDSVPERKQTLEETFDRIDNAGAWILMKRVHKDPDYNEVLKQCLREVQLLSGRQIDQDKKSQEAIIFLTSPNRVTSYHIDRECNFLMQVRGEKEISVFDRNDRDVLPEAELETFWSKDNNAGVYKPQYQDRAHVILMKPGTGVHIPVNFPHWLKNGNNVSISLSISYQYKDWQRKYVFQANYYLRKIGLNPTPPGKSALLDNTKRIVMQAGFAGKKLLHPGRPS
ncbi:MAG: cupin-like domain-containing protein [Silvibacterium sp.]|nr:cupin-like domain-containing protein [Silvibacterium sp.]